jgi:phospholipid transport system substrate-binding protein
MFTRILSIAVLLLVWNVALAADYSTPMGRVQDSVERVLGILNDTSLDQETQWRRIAVVIDESFDFRSMSQSVLSTHWRRATLEERERFTEFFSQYIEETYRSKIEAYTDQKIEYKKETINGDRAVVDVSIVTNSATIPVSFKLKDNGGDWFAYDVVIEGVSLVNNYRNIFTAIAKNEGMNGLLSDIQRRIDHYKSSVAGKKINPDI